MCGIVGFIGEDQQKIDRMVSMLRHRGPDNQATVVTHGASLGNARLAILDPRPEGHQPMWNDEKTILITYNGEIYNYKKLREQERLDCRTNTDTEVILKLYERHGMTFINRLIGMFAFAIYDTRDRSLHLSRDPSGILPLFLAVPDGKPHFASEMRTLMHALPEKPALNLTSLSQYVRLQYVPGPETMCEGIEFVPAGSVISWKDGKLERRIVLPVIDQPEIRWKEEFKEQLPPLMDEVVKDHLVSDKPVGIFLSGGMDSSILLHHMNNHVHKPIKTFTVRFDVTQKEDATRMNTDAELARRTAAHYGTEHQELFLTAQDYRSAYEDTARSLDQPNADAVSVAQSLLAKKAKQEVDVILTGAGGDELFGGYPRYRIARMLHASRTIPAKLRSILAKLTGHPQDVVAMKPGPELAERLLARPLSEIQLIMHGEWFTPNATSALFADRFAALDTSDPIRTFMEFDRGLWLPDESLRLADAVSLGHGLESRVPFLDPRLIAFSHATPANWHVSLTRTKALLKDTYRPILPDHLFTLKKASFFPPLAKWFRRECGPLVEEMLTSERIAEFFDITVVRQIYDDHRTHRKYGLHTLATLTQLDFWFKTVYDA